MSRENVAGVNSTVVDDAVRVVDDNLDATEAWNGPLFDMPTGSTLPSG